MSQTVARSKKATNITLSADVLAEAKALGIDIPQARDEFLRELVRRERRRLQDHADLITAYNETVAREGLPRHEWRSFCPWRA